MPFRIEISHDRDTSLMRLSGEIDSTAVCELHRRLPTDNGSRAFVVDLTGG